MEQQNRFLFSPEFRWPKDKESAPFFTFPAWWRRFLFHVLRPRDLTVYHYYLSIMNQAGVAFPSVDQIASDLGIKDKDSVRKAITILTDCGFLLKPDQQQRTESRMGKRPVYQRPCVQYTIHKLLTSNKIDGELYPGSNRIRSQHDKASDPVVRAGLKTMLGDMFPAYEKALESDDNQRDIRLKGVLGEILKTQLKARKKAFDEMVAQQKSKPINSEAVAGYPENIRKWFTLEELAAEFDASTPGPSKISKKSKLHGAISRLR